MSGLLLLISETWLPISFSLEMRGRDDTDTGIVFFLTMPSHACKWGAAHSDDNAAILNHHW